MRCCPQTGKLAHTRSKADAHLRSLKRRRGYRGEVYRCRHCCGWHVGRPRVATCKREHS